MDKIKVIVVGCGDRATVYAKEGYKNLQKMQIVAAVDPDKERLKYMQTEFDVPKEFCFKDISELLKLGKIADCVINGTMDSLHVKTTIPFLEQGYDVLLEKPITNNEEDLLYLKDTAAKYGCKLFVCHVLRYSPFYRRIKEILLSGEIGKIVNINTTERVGVVLSSAAFIRGKWNKQSECGSSLLLAKCCHDLDLLCWLNNETVPEEIYSDGGRNFITPDKAPKGAGTRCLVDCPEEVRKNCVYDAKIMYMDNCPLPWYPWQCTGKNWWDVSEEEKVESLKTYNPHGKCAYKCDGDLVDHQNVSIKFKNGSTAQHSMLLGCIKGGRSIYIAGTLGEIEGFAEEGRFVVRHYDRKTSGFTEKAYDFNDKLGESGGHFGGDRGLVQDFTKVMLGEGYSISCTSIEDSINGHIAVFRADESMKTGKALKFRK